MTEAHWFAHYCPFFSVYDLEKYNSVFGESSVIELKYLRELEMHRQSLWLFERQVDWRRHLKLMRWSLENNFKFEAVFWRDPHYPAKLKRLSFPPAVLFYRGQLEVLKAKTVAVVGARAPTNLGRLWVREVVPELLKVGITLVSGGARGIDFETHDASIKHGGCTASFLPGGVDLPYPKSHGYLFEKILVNGLIISEFANGTEVRPENFYRRNRLISGSADVVVIVEAAFKSGTMVTARSALREGVDLLVVPGPPMVRSYEGSLELLNQGAGLARDHRDILEIFRQKKALIKNMESPTVVI